MTVTSASRHTCELSRIGPPLLRNGAIGGLLGGLVLFLIMASYDAANGMGPNR
jgi:hypothetical protein